MYVCICTSDNVDELRSVGVRRQVEAIGFDGAANDGNTGALELLVVWVPGLDQPGFRLNAGVRLEGLEVIELALILAARVLLRPRPRPRPRELGQAALEEDEQAK